MKLLCVFFIDFFIIYRCFDVDCGKRNNGVHKGGFERGCLQGFLACLSNLGKLQDPPGNFIIDVTRVLMEHQHEFSQNY